MNWFLTRIWNNPHFWNGVALFDLIIGFLFWVYGDTAWAALFLAFSALSRTVYLEGRDR